MHRMISCIAAAACVFIYACTQEYSPNEPPICRDYQLIKKTSNGTVSYDTIYHALPAFALTNQAGERVQRVNSEGKIRIVSFFSTTGSKENQLMQTQMQRLYERWAKEKNIRFLSFTTQPEYDSVEKLKAYAREKNIDSRRWQLLTGERKELDAIKSNLFMMGKPSEVPGPSQEQVLILLDRQGRVRGFYEANNLPSLQELARDVDLLSGKI